MFAMMKDLPGALFLLLCSFQLVAAFAWDGMNGRASMGSLIAGLSQIEAKGPSASGSWSKYLDIQDPDKISNLTIVSAAGKRQSPLFYINQEQLYLLVNETTVYPVNVQNSTAYHDLPMQLVLGDKRDGITTGKWFWKTTQLYYELPGGKSNDGLYFKCLTESGWFNVFMSNVGVMPPHGCSYMSLHSFIRDTKKR
ncbi:hypothetical protein D9619_000940 [Psilocybe cf. subviscida]|uniref:Uncharacterized protein n=1 Tax=Psilocybe cf. subviscida TaxID=2480587 RepID=A0A8H5F315_9AGAR|nr:hypothetical protein D9619_000940 [Psilocybe cf. subviscida]